MPGLLVADDMPIVRATVAKIVADENLELRPVAEACNGAEAVSLARQMHPDVVLMDIKMPGMDGLEAASTIRSEQPNTKIVMLSAYDEFSYIRQAFSDVANAVHMSPSHLAALLKAKAGISYVKYLRSLRIAHAIQLLRTTNLIIEAIAATVGYTAISNFYRLFQRETGMTPAALRREESEKPVKK